jgi:hypothetical protein
VFVYSFCGVFLDAANRASHAMIPEHAIGEDMEKSGRGLI